MLSRAIEMGGKIEEEDILGNVAIGGRRQHEK
jgi:hypothetical protein